jgi:hypothetical protein
MSQVRVHNFAISLDGFGTGDGITFDAPFGHAGERLHQWMFATRFWHSMLGEPRGTEGVDHCGTVFHFVDASPQDALGLARDAAGDLDVRIGGGPTLVRDFLGAGLIDTAHLVQVPIVLGRGVRLWDGLEGVEERYDIEAVSTPSGVTHLTFTRR